MLHCVDAHQHQHECTIQWVDSVIFYMNDVFSYDRYIHFLMHIPYYNDYIYTVFPQLYMYVCSYTKMVQRIYMFTQNTLLYQQLNYAYANECVDYILLQIFSNNNHIQMVFHLYELFHDQLNCV